MSTHRVVISGISGRFPNADNINEFRDNLLNNVDCTTDEHGRWNIDDDDIPQRIGKCNDLEKFDRIFFGVHSKLTNAMDPMSRILLECSFSAIMDAGVNPRTLRGANVAVFNASSLSESEKIVFSKKSERDGFLIMGCSKAMIPNRVSFFLGLSGPSVNIDNEMSGSATALEYAYNAIRDGRCDAAIVSGCMVALHPHISYQLRKLGLLSQDGYTRSFDDSADGHTRSDGVAALYLQRASDAKRVYQEVINVHSKHCQTITFNDILMFPEVEDQIEVMKNVLNESGLTPNDIIYVEGSGMGMKDADAMELEAIDAVYGKRKSPLPIGSIKSVIGNAPAVSFINSIIKMIIGSESGLIPANSNYEEPNSKSDGLKSGRLFVHTDSLPWTGEYSAINSTSIIGSFSNLILKSPNIKKKNDGVPDDDIPRLVLASGRTEEAVLSILNYVESRPVDAEYIRLLHNIFESDVDGHLYRGYTLLPAKGLIKPATKKQETLFITGETKQIWWVYSGMGSQWAGMGEALLQLPVFEAAIKRCDAVLKPRGYDIFKVITDKDPKTFDLIINSFIGIAAIQIGLTDVLKSLGLEPEYIIGHSVGELGCAYADGCFTAEQMILAALSRGLASVETKLDRGSMAAVGLGYEDLLPLCPPDIDIACHNGPESSTISGPAESMKAFVADLTAKGIFAREVNSSNIAYHSRYIAPAGPNLMRRLQEVIPNPKPRSAKWVSTSIPRKEWTTPKARLCSAEYHTNNLLSAVLFDETSRLIPANAVCIEIAPHGLLQAIVKRSLPKTVINIALTRREHPNNLEVLLAGVGQMYNIGMQPQISNIYPKIPFPVSTGTPSISSLVQWDHSTDWTVHYVTPTQEKKGGDRTLQIDIKTEEYQYLQGCVIDGQITIPSSLFLVKAWEILRSLDDEMTENIIFEDVRISKQQITISKDQIIPVTVVVSRGTGKFEVIESGATVLSGILRNDESLEQERLNFATSKSSTENKFELNQDDVYTELSMRGLQHSDDFKGIIKASLDGTRAIVRWNENWILFLDCIIQAYILSNDSRRAELPVCIRKIIIDTQRHATLTQNSNDIEVIVNQELNHLSAGGVEIQGLKCHAIPRVQHQETIATDSWSIVPNLNKTELPLKVALRSILQLVAENIFSPKIQRIELIGGKDSQNVGTLCEALLSIPEICLYKVSVIEPEDANYNGKLNIIADDITVNLTEISKKLKDGAFLLTSCSLNGTSSYSQSSCSVGLKLICCQKSDGKNLILLRKVPSLKFVKLAGNHEDVKDIISNMKKIKLTTSTERVVITTQIDDVTDMVRIQREISELPYAEYLRIFHSIGSKMSEEFINSSRFTDQLNQDLFVNIWNSEGSWSTLRSNKVILKPIMCQRWSANSKYSHDPSSIVWTDGNILQDTVKPISVKFAALNHQDILLSQDNFYTEVSEVTGSNRILPNSLGLEFSGIDSHGKKIMGLTKGGSLSNFVEPDTDWIWPVPNSWSLEDAATVPLSYIIAYSALMIKAEVKPGETVLLTNACDGFGLALLQLATKKKCELFVSYKSESEKNIIKSICPNIQGTHLIQSSKDNFRNKVQSTTAGKGVDVIICNQDEIRNLERFFAITKHNARVVLISDLTDMKIHEYVGLEIFLREISLFSVVPAKILSSDIRIKRTLADLVSEGIKTAFVKPLPRIVYDRDHLQEAYDDCNTKKSCGKVILKIQAETSDKSNALAIPRLFCSEKKSYIIFEGLNNFGLELIDWLVTRGAKRLIITSKSQITSGYKFLRLKLWKTYGVQIILREGIDISQNQIMERILKEATSVGPIDAIFDLFRTNITTERSKQDCIVHESITKKADQISRSYSDLRLFVICSVVTNGCGGCGIYSEEDKLMDRLVKQRRNDGLQGLHIRWGLLESKNEGTTTGKRTPLPPISKYLVKLDEILGTDETTVNVHCIRPLSDEVQEETTGSISGAKKTLIEEEAELFEGLFKESNSALEKLSELEL
ncbi:hypothetical protein QAD02_016574 [Eretmocerus hayati]|uniref:Uncharacterized protein n=1 Tax=Eretmocerus hayati TaxID=131215 RepID=A0ACC2PEA1_9HYME|nr:hypothetical protein QAD02_016574 [Eretmocerus hayati]